VPAWQTRSMLAAPATAGVLHSGQAASGSARQDLVHLMQNLCRHESAVVTGHATGSQRRRRHTAHCRSSGMASSDARSTSEVDIRLGNQRQSTTHEPT